MGRHKKDCNCEKCSNKNDNMKDNDNIKNNIEVESDIEKEIENEIRNEVEDKILFETNQNEPTQSSQSIEFKKEKIRSIIKPFLPSLFNLFFDKFQVSRLNEIEENLLIDSCTEVLAKYSDNFDFKYKEEFVFGSVLLVIISQRYNEYKSKQNEIQNEIKDNI